jgi:hypothetical protein
MKISRMGKWEERPPLRHVLMMITLGICLRKQQSVNLPAGLLHQNLIWKYWTRQKEVFDFDKEVF